MVQRLQLVSRSQVMKTDGNLGRGVEMAGEAGRQAQGEQRSRSINEIRARLPVTRTEAAVARGNCFAWTRGSRPKSFVCFGVSFREIS